MPAVSKYMYAMLNVINHTGGQWIVFIQSECCFSEFLYADLGELLKYSATYSFYANQKLCVEIKINRPLSSFVTRL